MFALTESSSPANTLAYAHHLQIEVTKEDLVSNHQRVVDLCGGAIDFVCTVLNSDVNHSDYPNASVRLRVSPEGVEPLTKEASAGGIVRHQSTSVEDLAESMGENTDQIGMLRQYLEDLERLRTKSDEDVQALIRVSSEIASVNTRLKRALDEKARLAQRVDYQILNINFSVDPNSSFVSPIGRALGDFGEDLSEGIATAITGFAYVLPWIIILLPVFYLLRLLWRRTRS